MAIKNHAYASTKISPVIRDDIFFNKGIAEIIQVNRAPYSLPGVP